MRIAGGILVGLGLVLIATALASQVLGTMATFHRVQEQSGYLEPGELADTVHRGLWRTFLCGGAAFVLLLVGLPLLIVGIVRSAGRRRNGAGPPLVE